MTKTAIAAPQTGSSVQGTLTLLGGETVITTSVRDNMDAHDLLQTGLPAESLLHLVSEVSFLEQGDALQKAVGLSLRTLQRRRAGDATRLLNVEQSNRTWRFAEIFAQASDVMGSDEAAEAWMTEPATGLSNRKPVDLLATSAGVEAISEYLTRLEYGVYM